MADLVKELGRLQFGGGIADALAAIGQKVKDYNNEKEAQRIISDMIPKLNISSPDFASSLAQIIGESAGLGKYGQTVANAAETSADAQFKQKQVQQSSTQFATEQTLEKEKLKQSELSPVYNQIDDYSKKLGSMSKADATALRAQVVTSIGQIADKYPDEVQKLLSSVPPVTDLSPAVKAQVDDNKMRLSLMQSQIDYNKSKTIHDTEISKHYNDMDAARIRGDWTKMLNDSNNTIEKIQADINKLTGLASDPTTTPVQMQQYQRDLDEAKARLVKEQGYVDEAAKNLGLSSDTTKTQVDTSKVRTYNPATGKFE